MLAKEYSWVPFHVVACNSQENGTDVQLLTNQKHATNKSWESSRSGNFPIEIIIRFHYRTELNHVLICTKLDKDIPGIEFYIGDGLSGSFLDAEYRLAGTYDYIHNKQVQIPMQGIGNFLKIRIKQQPKRSPGNPYQQVSMAVLRLWGRYTNYITKIVDHEIPLEMDKTNIDQILIGMGIPVDLLNWHDQDHRLWESAPIDEDTRVTVGDLQKLKQQALLQQDYEMLKALTQDIKKVFDIGVEIHRLTRELKFAIAKEDFDRAMELKKRLLDLRNRRDGFDALYETSRYENMVCELRPNTAEFDNMVRLMDEEAENDRLRNLPREKTPDSKPPSSHHLLDQHQPLQSEPQNDRDLTGLGDKDLAWWEKTTGEDMKLKQRKKKRKNDDDLEKNVKIESKFKNPFAFNEGDVDLELYFRPLMANTGEQMEDIPAEMLRRLYNLGYLTVFGAKVWTAIHSENWRHREAAAQAVLNFIEMPLPDKYLNGNSKLLFLACLELAKLACEDKILSIYFIGLKILSTALSPPVCGTDVSPKLINQGIQEFIPLLIDKIAELNFRSRDISMHTLLSVFKHPAIKVGELIKQCLKICIEDPNFASLYTPPDKQPERVIKARLEIILSIVQDQGIDEREWQWTDAFIYLCVPSLFHPSNEVRMLSIELIVAMYLVIGEDVRNTVNDVDMKPNLYEILVERMDEIKEQAAENQKVRDEIRGEILREQEEKEQRKLNNLTKNQSQIRQGNKSQVRKQYQPNDYSQFKKEVDELQGKIEEKGVNFALDCVVKYKNSEKPLGAIISMNPPASYYHGQIDGSVKFNCNLDYTSFKENPHFLNTFCDFVNVSPQGAIIIELKFIDNLDKKIIKDYGWAVLPLYREDGELNKGELQLPIYKPPVNIEIIQALSGQPDQKDFLEKQLDNKKSGLKFLEWSSVVVRLQTLQNKGQTNYFINNLNTDFLPAKKKDKFLYTEKIFNQAEKDKIKKPVSKIIPAKKTQDVYQEQVETVFKESFGVPLEPPSQ